MTDRSASLFGTAGLIRGRLIVRSPIVVASTAACALVATFARWGPDWPALEFRALVATISPLPVWNDNWYAGTAMAGYSVVCPMLSRLIGTTGTAVAASGLCAWGAARLPVCARRDQLAMRASYGAAVTLVVTCSVLIGQLSLLLGIGIGLAAVHAQRSGRLFLAGVLAALTSMTSPLAGAFLLIAGIAMSAGIPWRRVVPYGGAVLGLTPALLLGGAAGSEPCPWQAVMAPLGVAAGILALVPRDGTATQRGLYRFAGCYLGCGVAAFVIPDPVGGNVARLAWLIALPLTCWLLPAAPRRRVLPALVAVIASMTWTLVPLVDAVTRGVADPARNARFYTGLLAVLRSENPNAGRLEIPFTRDHWEARWVAPHFPLARGWERQTDYAYNAVLYRPLTAASYRRWLYHDAVHWIALPDVALDPGGLAEARLLRHPPGYLRLIWRDAHWRLWRVDGAPPMAGGAARLTQLGAASLTLRFNRPGTSVVRIHASPLWQVTSGDACLTATPGGWLRVKSARPGVVTMAAAVNGHLLGGRTPCS